MHFSINPIKTGINEMSKERVSQESEAAQEMASKGYASCIFNMLFLLQMKITKQLSDEQMDEHIFRSYFKKLYKSMTFMEADFLELLEE